MRKYFLVPIIAFAVLFSCGKKSENNAPLITVVLTPATSEISSQTGSSATIEVVSSVAMPADGIATIEVVAGSAPDTEYTTTPAAVGGKVSVALPKGATKASFTVTAVKKEATTDRNVTFKLTSVSGANLGPNTQHTVKIKASAVDPKPEFKTAAQIAALDSGAALTAGEKMAGIVVLAKDNITTNNLVLQNSRTYPGIVVRFDVANTFEQGDSLVITFAQGDYVRTFNGSKQANVKIANVQKISSGNSFEPRTITLSQLKSRAFENGLIKIEGVSFDPATGTLSGSKNFKVGSETAVLFTTSNASFASQSVPSGQGSIIGIAGFFRSSVQVNLRSVNDLVGFSIVNPPTGKVVLNGFGDVKKYSLADSLKPGQTLTGIVTLSKTNINVSNMYIQDATGGTQVRFIKELNKSNLPGSAGVDAVPFEIGDEVELRISDSVFISDFNGQKQIYFFLNHATKKASGKSVTPRTVTIAEFNARTYEGELLRINDITFDDANGTNKYYAGTGAGTNRKFTSGTAKGELRTNNSALFKDEVLPSGAHDLIGVAGSFSGTAQLFMRTKDDAIKR